MVQTINGGHIWSEHQDRYFVNMDIISRGQPLDCDSTPLLTCVFFQYVFYHTDPRRVQPLVNYILQAFNDVDYNAEMTFDAIKVLSLFRAFYEELGRKFTPWADAAVHRCWAEISSEHDDVSVLANWTRLSPQTYSAGPCLCRGDFNIHRKDQSKSRLSVQIIA